MSVSSHFCWFLYFSSSHRGFDIGNHFCEWMYDYDCDEFPYFSVNTQAYPSKAQQVIACVYVRVFAGCVCWLCLTCGSSLHSSTSLNTTCVSLTVALMIWVRRSRGGWRRTCTRRWTGESSDIVPATVRLPSLTPEIITWSQPEMVTGDS